MPTGTFTSSNQVGTSVSITGDANLSIYYNSGVTGAVKLQRKMWGNTKWRDIPDARWTGNHEDKISTGSPNVEHRLVVDGDLSGAAGIEWEISAG